VATKLSIKLLNSKQVLKEINEEVILLTNQALRINALQAQAELQFKTPVLTGRARASWNLSAAKGDFKETGGASNSSSSILPLISSTEFQKLYLTNSVPYIQDLNMGNSKQAPARFIESTVFKYFAPKGVVVEVTR